MLLKSKLKKMTAVSLAAVSLFSAPINVTHVEAAKKSKFSSLNAQSQMFEDVFPNAKEWQTLVAEPFVREIANNDRYRGLNFLFSQVYKKTESMCPKESGSTAKDINNFAATMFGECDRTSDDGEADQLKRLFPKKSKKNIWDEVKREKETILKALVSNDATREFWEYVLYEMFADQNLFFMPEGSGDNGALDTEEVGKHLFPGGSPVKNVGEKYETGCRAFQILGELRLHMYAKQRTYEINDPRIIHGNLLKVVFSKDCNFKYKDGEYKAGDITTLEKMTGLPKSAISGIKYVGFALAGSVILSKIDPIREGFKSIAQDTGNTAKNVWRKVTNKGINVKNYREVLNRIEKHLRKDIVGQDAAIDRIMEILRGHFEAMFEAKKMGKKFEHGLMMYFNGSPATGKSTAMNIIRDELGLNSYMALMSDVMEDKGNNANTVAARLTKDVTVDDGKKKRKKITPFVQQLKSRLATLYCIDEIDKMRIEDSKLAKRDYIDKHGKVVSGSMDEMLRNFGDKGMLAGYEAMGSIVIATSNETEEDMKKLESSLYNRYKNCSVHFKDLENKDYQEIIRRNTVDVQNYYKKFFNSKVEWSEKALDYFGKKFETDKAGARSVDALINDVRSTLVSKRDIMSDKELKGTTLVIEVNENSGKLNISVKADKRSK